jgi:hypothetical protein
MLSKHSQNSNNYEFITFTEHDKSSEKSKQEIEEC